MAKGGASLDRGFSDSGKEVGRLIRETYGEVAGWLLNLGFSIAGSDSGTKADAGF